MVGGGGGWWWWVVETHFSVKLEPQAEQKKVVLLQDIVDTFNFSSTKPIPVLKV